MGNDVARREDQAVAPSVETNSQNFMAMLIAAAKDPAIDAAKTEAMANLAIKLQDRERETEFNRDLAAALVAMPRITKQGRIIIPGKDGRPAREQGRYAKFEDIDAVIRPLLAEHNLAIRFELGSDGPLTTARPIIIHRNGHVDKGDALKVPRESSGSKNDVQAVGSSASYAKRYAMCAALNIVMEGEDTDGRYPLPDDPLNDVQERKVAEAEQSAKDGHYAEWYGRQTPGIREFLVVRGIHARLGKAVNQIATDRPTDNNRPEPEPAPDPERQPEPSPVDQPKAKRTVVEMLGDYRKMLGEAGSTEALMTLQTDPKITAWLDKLKASHPDLHGDAVTAASVRYSELVAAEPK